MRQPIKKKSDGKPIAKKKRVFLKKSNGKADIPHPKYGTSKLEDYFASEFLDKLKLKYERQYEAKEIGRFYDFCVRTDGGSPILIEVDGDYYHANPNKIDESSLSPMQKRNRRVDELKNEWALKHCIPIIRIWEDDIRNNPKKVMTLLKERFYLLNSEEKKKEEKVRKRKILK